MADQQDTQATEELEERIKALTSLAERATALMPDVMARIKAGENDYAMLVDAGRTMAEASLQLLSDPDKLVTTQVALLNNYIDLWRNAALKAIGETADPVIEPERGDRRFRSEDWQDNPVFDFIKQSYLLTAQSVQSAMHDVEGLDEQTARKVDFYTKQFLDAVAPTNFVMTNPDVLKATVETGGDNLVHGMENLLTDIEKGKGQLRISMTDESAFEIGKNVAVSPGKVVYQNNLFQLIQYSPTTEKVKTAPILIAPPWINKFYILDLREKNSLVKWLTDQGFTTFIISWVNPDAELAQKTFEDYMTEGFLEAMEAAKKATGSETVNLVGYCIGGTLLACMLAWLTAKGRADEVASATFFVAMTDFEDIGDIKVFVDEEQIENIENRMEESGYLDGSIMATTFNTLRSNDLIWSFVVNNYLMGKDPFPFDLLYWNSDSTRMPLAMHSYYLRNMYLNNNLVKPGELTIGGVPMDLSTIKVPTTMVACKEDHIAPWKTVYRATQFWGSKINFILAASGHIAGVVNPPAADKYCHWMNAKNPKTPDEWLESAEERPGSWWPDWAKWLKTKSGPQVKARVPGKGKLKAIEDAPGSYVKMRNDAD